MLSHPIPAALLLVLALCACSSSTSNDDQAKPMPQDPQVIDWTGPPVHTSVEKSGANPNLVVEITVPTGGWELAVDHVEQKGTDVIIDLKLTRPGDDEIVTQALVTHSQKITSPLPSGRALVRVAEWKRGVQYLVAPAFQLASKTDF